MKRFTWLFAAVLACLATAALADETGTRVVIRTSKTTAAPDPEKVVDQLVALGGKHEVLVSRHDTEDQNELTLDVWGSTLESKDIAPTLRQAFPALAAASIDVSTVPASEKPRLDEAKLREAGGGKVKIIKKLDRGH